MEELLLKERTTLGSINTLYSLCKRLNVKPKSSFDPMYKISVKLKSLVKSLEILYKKHSAIYSEIMNNLLIDINIPKYDDIELLMAYETFFQSTIRLIFNSTSSVFRNVNESDFLKLFLTIYSNLKRVLGLTEENKKLSHVLKTFENEFHQSFLNANSNSYNGGNVKNILSHISSPSKYPNINPDLVGQCHYLKLDSTRMGYNKLLAEVVELNTDELAFFQVETSNIIDVNKFKPDFLLEALVLGQYDLLNFNKSLLFIPLKAGDLRIMEYTHNGMKLETQTGNNIQVEISSENLIEWETSWKYKFEQYFDQTRDIRHVENPSTLKPLEVSTLKESIVFDKNSRNEIFSPIKEENENVLSSMNNDTLSVSDGSRSTNNTSIADFEKLSYEKLLELNDSIPVELSPVIQQSSPRKEIIRSVSETFTLETVDPRISSETESHELTSIISDMGNTHISDKPIFNPSASEYKPILSSKKSSSLLSLFSTNNSHHDCDIENERQNIPTMLTSEPISIFGNYKPIESIDETPKRQFVSNLSKRELDNCNILFQNKKNIKLSYWSNKNAWEQVGDSKMNINISRLRNGTVILFAYNDFNKDECYLVSKISSSWKCLRTTAQDIQIKFPIGDIIDRTFTDCSSIVLTIRYYDADLLLNILQKGIDNNFRKPLSNSSTQETLATTGSSKHNESIFSYGVASTSSMSLEEYETNGNTSPIEQKIQLHLLVANTKVKYHSLQDGKIWKFQNVGIANIYSQDISQYERYGAQFEFSSQGITKTFSGRLDNIKRLKRTGMIIHDNNEEYHLLEFTNQTVADHVFKMIHSIF